MKNGKRGLLKTGIEWADYVWNIVTGCSPVSAGCEKCYAKAIHTRFNKTPFSDIVFHPDRLEQPLNTRKPGVVFVNSMGDFFHDDVNIEWIDQCLEVMCAAVHHEFVILTKRADRIEEKLYGQDGRTGKNYLMRYFGGGDYLKNLWLGVSVENQKTADARIPTLLQIPAAKYIVSVEPMLGPVDVRGYIPGWLNEKKEVYSGVTGAYVVALPLFDKTLDLVICGAESGPGRRPMELAWARSLSDQCDTADVPFFFKKDSDGNPALDGVEQRQWPKNQGR